MHNKVLDEIRTLHQLGGRIGTAQTLGEVLQAAADAVSRLLPSDRVSIIELDVTRRAVGYFARGGSGQEQVVAVTFDELESGLSGWVLKKGKSALSSKMEPDPRESPEVWARRQATDCGSIIVVPLRQNGRVLGTMTAINRQNERDFDMVDVETMELFADYCAIVIENTRLFLERKQAELDLQRQNAMKDKLFTILAHDLRGPIGNTCVLLGLISDQLVGNEELAEILQEGTRSAFQTYNLTENLLGWVRGQMTEITEHRTRVALGASLSHIQAWLEPQARTKRLNVQVECPGHLTVLADEAMLQTVVRNLLSNAIKYSAAGSSIHIRGLTRGTQVLVEVVDHGEGIPPEKVAQLFGAFQVASTQGTSGERGNGLGLMFCADLARSMDGSLEVESQLGQGSTFRLVLPDEVDEEL